MCETFEKTLIGHCAPTLAGHKCGSLFNLHGMSQAACTDCLMEANALLQPKGVSVRLLKECKDCCLIYVYRPAQLQAKLQDTATRSFLADCGYTDASLERMLEQLSKRITGCADFPHEIGVFLDYPLEDVKGFIAHRGANYTCLGCWKAYGNAQEAQRRFSLYRKCKTVYQACYQRGFGVMRLTVAA